MNKHRNILAKPSGITLETHVSNVIFEATILETQLPFVFEKYQQRIGKSLSNRLKISCKHHDDGKKHPKWQTACKLDYQAFKKWQKQFGGTFKDYEKAAKQKVGENIRAAGFRHEFSSLDQVSRIKMPEALLQTVKVAIAAHHSKLGHRFADRWIKQNSQKLWDEFRKESNRISESESFAFVLQKQYEIAGPRSLLQFADRRASAIEGEDFVPDLNNFQYQFPHQEKRGVQKLIEDNWEKDLLLLRAPTGAGKTDASLLWASMQIQNNKADRLIIAMPTRFTSNALAISVSESLSETGLYHSSAWFTKFQDQVEEGGISKNIAGKIHDFARLLYTPITVCTIDHLLTALTLSREDHHQITFNLANSCLVIDEADFYDDFTQANILVLLQALKTWGCPTLLMSASLPESVIHDYRNIGFSIDKILEDNSDYTRTRFIIKSIKEFHQFDDIDKLFDLCISAGSAIIYVNTVARAVELYEYLNNKCKDIKVILYHSRFTEPDKKLKEEELINHLGKKAWKEGNANGIAVLTQIGEMSINISADIMISEIAPIDRLAQRAGRLCRFDNKKIGNLYITIPMKDDKIYPAPYGSYNRKLKKWEVNEALIKTKDNLKLIPYNAKQLVDLINIIYHKGIIYSPIAKSNAKTLKDSFLYNWMINPAQRVQDDDNSTNFWKSRNIEPQDTVFVELPKSRYFPNYHDFQAWKLRHTIEIPIYLIKKYSTEKILDLIDVYIFDDKESVYAVKTGFYNLEKGISLPNQYQFL